MDIEIEKQKTDWKELVSVLCQWFDDNARILAWREDPTPYHVWLSEIMLQQTRVEAVKSYYDKFIHTLPDIKSLAEADEEVLLKLWEGLGYYSRVRNLQKAAKIIVEQYNCELPADYNKLLKLPGIGAYTAGAVGSIAFHLPVPAVDGNVLRVISRIIGSFDDIAKDSTKKEMTNLLFSIMPEHISGVFNQALMELGATVCIPNGAPLCESCPVYGTCVARKQGLTDQIPVKTGKKERRIENRIVLVIRKREAEGYRYLVRKRLEKGLLAGLWEWPNFLVEEMNEATATQYYGLTEECIIARTKGKHIFSHIEWHMTGMLIDCDDVLVHENEYLASMEELQEQFAIPSAFSAFTQWLKGE